MTGRLLLTSIQVDNIMPETHFLGQKKQGDTLYGVQVRTGQCHEGEGGFTNQGGGFLDATGVNR